MVRRAEGGCLSGQLFLATGCVVKDLRGVRESCRVPMSDLGGGDATVSVSAVNEVGEMPGEREAQSDLTPGRRAVVWQSTPWGRP